MQHDFILLDRSGSMGALWKEAVSSVNSYVKKLAADKVDTGVTLAVFDTDHNGVAFNVIRDRIIPSTWRDVEEDEAPPRGLTPLNDAVGKMVALAKAGNYDKVAIIIMTDGQENASKEFSTAQAKALLDECRAKNWQVIFLGADFDNTTQAQFYGNSVRATATMSAGNFAMGTTMLSAKRASYGVSGQSINFSDDEKAELLKKKAQ